jgi:hypothetical protein
MAASNNETSKPSVQPGSGMKPTASKTGPVNNPTGITLPKPPPPNQHHETGVVKIAQDSQMPREYISPPFDLNEASVTTFIRDDNEVNDITRLYDWLQKFHVDRGLDTLRMWLSLRRSVQGKGLIYSLMAHAQIIAPRALGIKLSPESSDDIKEVQRQKKREQQDREQKPG